MTGDGPHGHSLVGYPSSFLSRGDALVVAGWKLLVRHVSSVMTNVDIKFLRGPAPYIQFYRVTLHAIG